MNDQLLHTLSPDRGGHSTYTTAVAVSQDGSLLATGGKDGTVFVWHVETGTRLVNLKGDLNTDDNDAEPSMDTKSFTGEVTSLRFTKDGFMLISSHRSGDVCFWHLRFSKFLHPKVPWMSL